LCDEPTTRKGCFEKLSRRATMAAVLRAALATL
jgi:hypothetical protein